VIGGLNASTLITLVLIPVIYAMVADLVARRAQRRNVGVATGPDVSAS
jgi:Cu/Ag efflux pump CusA